LRVEVLKEEELAKQIEPGTVHSCICLWSFRLLIEIIVTSAKEVMFPSMLIS